MPLPQDLEGSSWASKIARAIFPWLLSLAENHQTITYGMLDREIVRRRIHKHVFPTNYGYPAGAIGNAVDEIADRIDLDIPPLNSIVVKASGPMAGLPGHGCGGYLQAFLGRKFSYKKLSRDDKRAVVQEVHDAVFSFPHWDRVRRYVGDVVEEYPELASEVRPSFLERRSTTPRVSTGIRRTKWNFKPPPGLLEQPTGEGEAHRTLKEFIAANPQVIGLPRNAQAKTEEPLGSGDRADVFFTLGDRLMIAEVKPKNAREDDLKKGVFQCVKYRSLVRAHQLLKPTVPNGNAILVLGGPIPDSVKDLANRLRVRWFDESHLGLLWANWNVRKRKS